MKGPAAMLLRPSLVRAIADHARAIAATAPSAPVSAYAAADEALVAAGRTPSRVAQSVRETCVDVMTGCLLALGVAVEECER